MQVFSHASSYTGSTGQFKLVMFRNGRPFQHKIYFSEPRWRSGLRRWFASATHRGSGVSNPASAKAEFGRLALE